MSWTCPHGIGHPAQRGDCPLCNAELQGRPQPEAMSGDERAEEVRALLNDRHTYRLDDVHARIDVLVGRPTWSHEFATDTRLMEEARGALPHPENLGRHAVESLRALTDKPIVVVGDE